MNYANKLPVYPYRITCPNRPLQVPKDSTIDDLIQPFSLQEGSLRIIADLMRHAKKKESGFPVYCIGVLLPVPHASLLNGQDPGVSSARAIILRPGDSIPPSENPAALTGIFVFFTKAFLQVLEEDEFSVVNSFLLADEGTFLPIKETDAIALTKLFKRIFQVIGDLLTSSRELIIRHLLISLLLETHSILSGNEESGGQTDKAHILLYYRFKQLVSAHARSERCILFYTGRLAVSKNYLYKVIRSVSNISPKKILNDQVLKEAKMLLKQSPSSIGEIADSLSFSDLFVFSKFFKKHTGVSPSVYRRNYILSGLPPAMPE